MNRIRIEAKSDDATSQAWSRALDKARPGRGLRWDPRTLFGPVSRLVYRFSKATIAIEQGRPAK